MFSDHHYSPTEGKKRKWLADLFVPIFREYFYCQNICKGLKGVCVWGGGMVWQTEKKEFSIAQNIPQISLWSLVNISIQWKNVKVLKASEWTSIMATAPLESAVSLFTSSLVITWRAQTTRETEHYEERKHTQEKTCPGTVSLSCILCLAGF